MFLQDILENVKLSCSLKKEEPKIVQIIYYTYTVYLLYYTYNKQLQFVVVVVVLRGNVESLFFWERNFCWDLTISIKFVSCPSFPNSFFHGKHHTRAIRWSAVPEHWFWHFSSVNPFISFMVHGYWVNLHNGFQEPVFNPKKLAK